MLQLVQYSYIKSLFTYANRKRIEPHSIDITCEPAAFSMLPVHASAGQLQCGFEESCAFFSPVQVRFQVKIHT